MAQSPPGSGQLAALGLLIWLIGSLILAIRLGIGERRMAMLRRRAVAAGPQEQALCAELATLLGLAAPRVLRSPFLQSPCLDGLRDPAILLPEESSENLRESLVHELAHLVRQDGFWNLLRCLATAFGWFQPLLWVLSRRLEATAEEVCDDYVVQFGADRARYAGHLLELAGRTLPPLCPSAVGMVSLRSMLSRRVVRILDPSRRLSTNLGARALSSMLGAGVSATVLAGLLGLKPAEAPPSAPPEEPASKIQQESVTPKSPSDVPINGRIVDLEGRPVAGVRVKIEELLSPKGKNLDAWLEKVRTGSPQWITGDLIEWNEKTPEKATREAVTDRDGRFRLDGIGGERDVVLSLRGDAIAYKQIDVVTRPIKPFSAPGFGNQYGPGSGTIYGAEFTYTAAPCRPIEGIVKDSKTGTPLEGVEIRSTQFADSSWVGTMALRVKSDAQGRFRLLGMPKGKNTLLAVPNDEQPYFLHRIEVPDPPGAGPVSVEVGLNRGLWIEGKLTEQATGKPVAEARLAYLPFLDNPFAQAIPEFGKDRNTDGTELQDRYLSKADGSFRLVGLPGHAIVGAQAIRGEYMTGAGSESIKGINKNGYFETYFNPVPVGRNNPTVMAEINPPQDAKVAHLDLQVRSGATVRYRVVDPEGKTVAGLRTVGRTSRGSYDEQGQAGEGEITNLYADEERTVKFLSGERKVGKVIRVRKGDDAKGSVVVTLEPLATIKGRIADADGNPVTGATIRPDLLPGGDFSPNLGQVGADADGRFTIKDVPTGCDYGLAIETTEELKNRRFTYRDKVAVKPGETTDVGEIRFKNN
jgi:beta-lactamase regulating signal transducer with metallopeptidase domain